MQASLEAWYRWPQKVLLSILYTLQQQLQSKLACMQATQGLYHYTQIFAWTAVAAQAVDRRVFDMQTA